MKLALKNFNSNNWFTEWIPEPRMQDLSQIYLRWWKKLFVYVKPCDCPETLFHKDDAWHRFAEVQARIRYQAINDQEIDYREDPDHEIEQGRKGPVVS
jgi:hypothetical protein